MPVSFSKLRITGFKSFAEPTGVEILPGLTGIVGPNGCGKSNIVEALRWAMGESSARNLRGGEMEDVIFAGTRDRKPLGMAEVTLTMVDPEAYEGPIPVEPEVMVEHDTPTDWDEDEARRQRAVEAIGDAHLIGEFLRCIRRQHRDQRIAGRDEHQHEAHQRHAGDDRDHIDDAAGDIGEHGFTLR